MGHNTVVKVLLEAGADVNKANNEGETPLTPRLATRRRALQPRRGRRRRPARVLPIPSPSRSQSLEPNPTKPDATRVPPRLRGPRLRVGRRYFHAHHASRPSPPARRVAPRRRRAGRPIPTHVAVLAVAATVVARAPPGVHRGARPRLHRHRHRHRRCHSVPVDRLRFHRERPRRELGDVCDFFGGDALMPEVFRGTFRSGFVGS